jgi:hypothetical protein
MLWYKKRLCVPEIKEIRELILREAHDSAYSIHPGCTKMYHDLKNRYWWYGMKRDIANMWPCVTIVKESKQNAKD